jgi:type IV secretion system protein TrbJ
MFKRKLYAVGTAALLLVAQAARAQEIVFDPTTFAQTIIMAAKAIQGEVYQDTNIIYQYKMMENQLLQATNLNPGAMSVQMNLINGDIQSTNAYVNNSQALYGNLNNASTWIGQVQSMASASGKSPQQWLNDENTLAQNGNKAATNLFQQGSSIAQQTQTLATRRQQLQQQLNASQTQQQTASLTTHYLDILASQNSSLMSLAGQQAQISAQKQSQESAQEQTNIQTQQTRINQQNTEFSTMNGLNN